ncbi:MAG TPA: hypothetical protein VNR68_03035 [Sphingomicrobium sp.]|nr:hypothetical protein [Sphingomicrobium sp.]
MRQHAVLASSIALALLACGRAGEQNQSAANPPAAKNIAEASRPAPPQNSIVESNGAASLAEPNGPIDPKSAEAAGQVVQSYGALIEQKHWSEANALWGDTAAAAKFEAILAQFADVHLEIGNPGDPEGAAGSAYVTVPAIFYGDSKGGQPFRRSAHVTLRRVNDVPGSSDAQRRWHIERIDWPA